MIHQFYKYSLSLELYLYREIPQTIIPYAKRFERSLSTEIRRFQKELDWKEMWTIPEVYLRLDSGYKFWIYRPANQIKGWVWLTPEGEIKNLYVSKWSRNRGIGQNLIYTAMNEALDLEYSRVWARVDIWNEPSKRVFEKVLESVGYKTNVKLVEEEY